VTEDVDNWMTRNHFTLRRVHSLLGIIPIGAFLIEHMLTNSLAWWPEKFNEQVHWLHEMHYLLWLEILFIFLPLAFHGIYGVAILLTARNNASQYRHLDNWRFMLQRWTGVVAILFLIVHLCHFRFAHWFGGEPYVGHVDPFGLTQHRFEATLGVAWFPIYLVGLIAAVFHFCNGIVTFCITWGITISVESRKRFSVAAGGLGVVLLLWGVMSLMALRTTPGELAPPHIERAHAMVEPAVAPKPGS